MRLNYNASKMDLQQQKDNITLNVILAYLTVLSNQEALDIARNRLQWTRHRWRASKFRIRKARYHPLLYMI